MSVTVITWPRKIKGEAENEGVILRIQERTGKDKSAWKKGEGTSYVASDNAARCHAMELLPEAWDTVFPLRHPTGGAGQWEDLFQRIHFPSSFPGVVTFEPS